MHFSSLIEFFEDQLMVARVDANTGILDSELQRRSRPVLFNRAPTNGYAPAVGRIFYGVANHLIENLVEQVFIGLEAGQIGKTFGMETKLPLC